MKTIEEWFNMLPEPYRTEALSNTSDYILDTTDESFDDAIYGAFKWDDTRQGHDYWLNVVTKIKRKIIKLNTK